MGAFTTSGMIEASATRSASTPRTCSRASTTASTSASGSHAARSGEVINRVRLLANEGLQIALRHDGRSRLDFFRTNAVVRACIAELPRQTHAFEERGHVSVDLKIIDVNHRRSERIRRPQRNRTARLRPHERHGETHEFVWQIDPTAHIELQVGKR